MKGNVRTGMFIKTILSDLYRVSGDKKWKSFFKQYLFSSSFKFVFWLRVCYFTRKNKILKYTVFPLFRLIYSHYKYKFGYDIPYAIEIGEGLLLYHFGGIVVSAERIGKNATLSHGCTIGMKKNNGKAEFPVIGDNLYMAPGSKIIGGITIGNGVAVGTNAVLMKSVDDNSVVVGIPGKVISKNGSVDYLENMVEVCDKC